MADPDAIGGTIARGGNAAQQSQGGGYNPLDVWTHTAEGDGQQGGTDVLTALATATLNPGPAAATPVGDIPGALQAQAGDLGEAVNAIGDAQGALATTGAVFGALTSLEQLISVPFSAIPFPALPAVRILDMAIGLPHAHSHPPNLTPPNPVPIPLPSFGPVIPIPFFSGASTVLINGMPAGRCLDMGLGIWCGGYFPMFEIFLGSSSVWIEGMRAARIGVDITKHCVFSSFKVAPGDPPLGVPIGTTVTASPNVIIGGVPMPSLMSLAMGFALKGAFKGLGKAAGAAKRARAARAASRANGPPAKPPARPPRRALPPAPERPALPAAPQWQRTQEAYEAAQEVQRALKKIFPRGAWKRLGKTRLDKAPKWANKFNIGAVHVYTHADGSRSVGLSGLGGRAVARNLEIELNRGTWRRIRVDSSGVATATSPATVSVDSAGVASAARARTVWRVSSEVDPELGQRLRRTAPDTARRPDNCAEPRAASAAHRSDSPITGYATTSATGNKPPAKHRLPVSERLGATQDEMAPCANCRWNTHAISEYAGSHD
ncbi:hypothetical protein KXR53_10610 [Inquilinus limosus]|uniref:PAAR domain-containing protein n=1 Tax=Inquilinus limosus TaxID=171674 RepID=UPI003F13F9AD